MIINQNKNNKLLQSLSGKLYTLNIIVGNIQGQTKPVYYQYKDNLNNILDSNIDNIIAKTVFTKPKLVRQNGLIT